MDETGEIELCLSNNRAGWIDVSPESEELVMAELRRELPEDHELYGIPLRVAAHCGGEDDWLFEYLDGSKRFAVVHLTYSGRPERILGFASYNSFQDFVAACEEST